MIAATSSRVPSGRVAEAFDALAPSYDDRWSCSATGSVQRAAVWSVLDGIFHPGDRVLDLGCGTGFDALHLARNGVRVHGIDISAEMIRTAREGARRAGLQDLITLECRGIEELWEDGQRNLFDGALSNFGALNCVEGLEPTAKRLSRLVRPGGHLVLCFMGRFCLWETLWYLFHARAGKAFRRLKGRDRVVPASFESGPVFGVRYPSVRDVIESFGPKFSLRSLIGVGVVVPPSYVERAAISSPRIIHALAEADRLVAAWPLLRGMGDHRLLVLTRGGQD